MIAPFDALRGNLSGRQELVYPTNNNKAWNAPSGKRSYARNYRASYIGMRRTSTGKVFFALKRKAATKISDATKLNMAVFGAQSAVYQAMVQNVQITSYMDSFWSIYGKGKTKYQTFLPGIREMLITKSPVYAWGNTIKIINPWIGGSHPGFTPIDVNQETLIKFYTQLAVDGGYFYIDTIYQGLTQNGATVSDIVNGTNYTVPNVLNLTIETISGTSYAKIGSNYILKQDRETYVTGIMELDPGMQLYSTPTVPGA